MELKYYLGKRPFGRKGMMLHSENCPFRAVDDSWMPVGKFSSAGDAMLSIPGDPEVIPCIFCSKEAKTGAYNNTLHLHGGGKLMQVYESIIAVEPLSAFTASVN